MTRSTTVIAAVLLALMALLAGGAALRESITIDEVAHISAGLSYWQALDMRMNPEHPPLPKLLAGLPLALRGTRADYGHISWTTSESLFAAFLGEWVFGDWLVTRWNDPATVVAWARAPMLALTLVLGVAFFIYGRRLGGDWGGLLALAAYVSAPVFLAFGPLVLTDLAITLFALVVLWQTGELWRDPSERNVWRLGLALGAAVLSKFSSGILLIALVVFALSTRWWPVGDAPTTREEARPWRRLRWRALRKSVFVAGIVVYAVYLMFSWNQPVDLPGYDSGGALGVIGRILMPISVFLRGLLFFAVTSSRPTFLLGEWHASGVWYYFPVVFALKSTLGFLGLLAVGAGLGIAGRRSGVVPADLRTHWRVLWVGLVVVTVVCLLSPMNISVRHFSIPIAILTLMLSLVPALLARLGSSRRRALTGLTGALAAASLVSAVAAYPYYIPYVNALGMGRPAYALVNDSNVDWNQALPEVSRFARSRGLSEIAFDEYGLNHMAAWLPEARPWNCQTPSSADAGKWVAVSANNILDSHNCAWLEGYPSESLGGGAVYAFQLPDPIPAAGSPGGPPLPAEHHFWPSRRTGPEMRPTMLEAIAHPERLPEIQKRMAAEYEKAQAEEAAKAAAKKKE